MAKHSKTPPSANRSSRITNRKARFNYHIEDKVEAGLALLGTEVKSLRNGKAHIEEGFARFRGTELWLYGVNISPYEQGNQMNHEPLRPRKLLLHRHQINKLIAKLQQKGWTLIPLNIYFNRGFAKVEIALAQGKTHRDKREDIKKKDADRQIQREMSRR